MKEKYEAPSNASFCSFHMTAEVLISQCDVLPSKHCIFYIISSNFLLTVPTYQSRVDICEEIKEEVQERNDCVPRNWH